MKQDLCMLLYGHYTFKYRFRLYSDSLNEPPCVKRKILQLLRFCMNVNGMPLGAKQLRCIPSHSYPTTYMLPHWYMYVCCISETPSTGSLVDIISRVNKRAARQPVRLPKQLATFLS